MSGFYKNVSLGSLHMRIYGVVADIFTVVNMNREMIAFIMSKNQGQKSVKTLAWSYDEKIKKKKVLKISVHAEQCTRDS